MPVLMEEDLNYSIPPLTRVKQYFDHSHIEDIDTALSRTLNRSDITSCLRPHMKVAVAAGSRGIQNIKAITAGVIHFLKTQGCDPFIVSAMGSHGGGNEDGQRQVLASYGITEDSMKVPVITTVDTVLLGYRSGNIPVWFDRAAAAADLIVPINRVKLHTDFDGPLQSGLCKMLVIGLGDQKGCTQMHQTPPREFASGLEDAARLILSKVHVGFGVAVMENAFDQTYLIEAIPSDRIISREKELVRKCKDLMAYIRIKDTDIIIVDQIGKNISGAGFDPNVLGRSSLLYVQRLPVPNYQRLVLLGLTEETHGNAIGLGLFDITTRDVVDQTDFEQVYANALAVQAPGDAHIPVIARDRDEAVRFALKCCRNIDVKNPKILEIKNTSELEYIRVSPALLPEVYENPCLDIVSEEQ